MEVSGIINYETQNYCPANLKWMKLSYGKGELGVHEGSCINLDKCPHVKAWYLLAKSSVPFGLHDNVDVRLLDFSVNLDEDHSFDQSLYLFKVYQEDNSWHVRKICWKDFLDPFYSKVDEEVNLPDSIRFEFRWEELSGFDIDLFSFAFSGMSSGWIDTITTYKKSPTIFMKHSGNDIKDVDGSIYECIQIEFSKSHWKYVAIICNLFDKNKRRSYDSTKYSIRLNGMDLEDLPQGISNPILIGYFYRTSTGIKFKQLNKIISEKTGIEQTCREAARSL